MESQWQYRLEPLAVRSYMTNVKKEKCVNGGQTNTEILRDLVTIPQPSKY